MSSADLTTAARIRDAALARFAAQGFAATTVRQIAGDAGVSPALVLHHYGSKDGLRAAVDAWFVEYLRSEKAVALTSGNLAAIAASAADNPELRPMLGYLNAALREGGPVADHVFDLLVDVTREMWSDSESFLRPLDDAPAAAAILVAFSAGASLLEPQVARHLGGTSLLDPAVYERYGRVSLDILARGILTADFPLLDPSDGPKDQS